jgi:hypothetical protein
MKASARYVALALAVAAPSGFACLGGGADAPAPPVPEGGAKSDATSTEGGGDGGGAGLTDAGKASGEGGAHLDGAIDATHVGPETTSTMFGLRVANWSPDSNPVDFCIAPVLASGDTGAFDGPIMAAQGGDGGTLGALAFPQVSAYMDLAPGRYLVRLLPAAPGIDCSSSSLILPADFKTDSPAAGATVTLALMGEAQPTGNDPALALVEFPDEYVGPPPKVEVESGALDPLFALRFINGAPGFGNADFLTGTLDSNGTVTHEKPAFSNVAFGSAKNGSDAGTFTFVNQMPSASLGFRAQKAGADAGAPAPMPDPTVTIGPSAVVTMALLGTTSNGGSLQLLECVDNAGTVTPYSLCTTISVSTCGNGTLDPFEQCDCGNPTATQSPMDARCFASDGVSRIFNGPCVDGMSLCPICSNGCTLNPQ